MAATLSELTEVVVSGFIRECERDLGDIRIPNDINHICIKFYGIWFNFESDILAETQDKSLLIDLLSQRFDIKTIQEIKLIYNSNIDGTSYESYKHYCHKKPKTVMLIKSVDNYIFGGYSSIPWSSTPGYKHDLHAFLFFLKSDDTTKEPKIFDVKTPERAVYHYCDTFGPWFGENDVIIWMSSYSDSFRCKFQDKNSYNCVAKDLCGKSAHSTSQYCRGIKCEMFQLLCE